MIESEMQAAEVPFYEPISIASGSDRLQGWSKCPPMSFETEDGSVTTIPERDWAFLDYVGFNALTDLLAAWSASHSIGWALECEGELLGTIKRGRVGRRLRRYVHRLAKYAGVSADAERRAARAEALREKYRAF
jgi:hypothetical protein